MTNYLPLSPTKFPSLGGRLLKKYRALQPEWALLLRQKKKKKKKQLQKIPWLVRWPPDTDGMVATGAGSGGLGFLQQFPNTGRLNRLMTPNGTWGELKGSMISCFHGVYPWNCWELSVEDSTVWFHSSPTLIYSPKARGGWLVPYNYHSIEHITLGSTSCQKPE